jgi:quercetin dioxygenase-like cupin family protein
MLAAPARGQRVDTTPVATTIVESHFTAPQPLPDGPLDQIFEVVNLEPGAATAIHYHLGPGFATILEGQVLHHRFALDRDTRYGTGDTWVEILEDVHYARNEALTPATILATFILPQGASPSNPTDDQLTPRPPEPGVPALVRIPIATVAEGYEVTHVMRAYDPGASTTSSPTPGSQTIVLVIEGQLMAQIGEDTRPVATGDAWVEGSQLPTTVWNPTSSIATVVASTLSPQAPATSVD